MLINRKILEISYIPIVDYSNAITLGDNVKWSLPRIFLRHFEIGVLVCLLVDCLPIGFNGGDRQVRNDRGCMNDCRARNGSSGVANDIDISGCRANFHGCQDL